MRYSSTTILATTVVLSANSVNAFTVPRTRFGVKQTTASNPIVGVAPLQSTTDDEVQRLQDMAAKLREEAASLEEKQKEERSTAAERAFRKFDTNNDGEVSMEELKAALEKTFKMEVPDDRVQRLMNDFDKNGDGKLQREEFVGVEQFRNRLEQIIADDRKQLLDAKRAAQKEAEVNKLIEAQLEMINDRTPTGTDKIVSCLPYLFPLMDGLTYGRFLFDGVDDNPVVLALAILYSMYRSVPFSGFIAFFGLSALSNNLSINRLTRYNIQQAIYLDIALFIPGFFGAILSVIGLNLPIVTQALGGSAIFLTLLAVIGYASVSSLFGVTPDKIPFISETVSNRMPPPADTLEFDVTTGQLVPKEKDVKKDE